MKRTCDINRNTNVFSQFRNTITRNNAVTPNVLKKLWLQENDASGVKIIQLSSSSSSKESVENGREFNHAQSYSNNDTFEEVENYRVNEGARSRRRMKHNENTFTTAYKNEYFFDCDMQTNSNPFYSTYDSGMEDHINHQMNCFTIINNQLLDSESSSDKDYEAIEIVEVDNTEDNNYWDHVYNDEVVTYDPNTQSEKRTIWIYSYKNKRLLSDDDFELVNIPGKDTSTSTSHSISDDEQKADRVTSVHRIGSPIPATYIPRLDISVGQTLSTVTEISEQNKTLSNGSSSEKVHSKPRNNWLTMRNDKVKKENSNVVNWMALSPRERRRRSINTTPVTSLANGYKADITFAEGVKQCEGANINSSKTMSSTVQVQVDIHVNDKETFRQPMTPMKIKAKAKEISAIATSPIKIYFADGDNDFESSDDLDYKVDDSKKPRIEISSKLDTTDITEPIEKLNCNNWISEEKDEEEAVVHHYDLENVKDVKPCSPKNDDAVSQRLWVKNLQLMKPPQWAEYLPITCSPPSLHLSLSLSSLNRKKTWFKRLTRCIMCCK